MARGTYIYLIMAVGAGIPLAAFTVKYEAHDWVQRSGRPVDQLRLFRTRDGGYQDVRTEKGWARIPAELTEIPFDSELL